jgi:hypothetical protein
MNEIPQNFIHLTPRPKHKASSPVIGSSTNVPYRVGTSVEILVCGNGA